MLADSEKPTQFIYPTAVIVSCTLDCMPTSLLPTISYSKKVSLSSGNVVGWAREFVRGSCQPSEYAIASVD